MKGHGQKLTRKQDAVISALLSEPTHGDAARKCGISEATLSRWLQLPEFLDEYKAARRKVVDHAIGRLCGLTNLAVDTLARNLLALKDGTQVRAALGILQHVRSFLGGEDMEEAIEELEAQIELLQAKVNPPTHRNGSMTR